jgi:hypothetical protein
MYWRAHPKTTIKLFSYRKGVEYFVNYESFGAIASPQWMDTITAMRPRRLVDCLGRKYPYTNPHFSLPFFDNVTHLEICDYVGSWVTWSGFHHLRRLSHILLPVGDGVPRYPPSNSVLSNAVLGVRVVMDLLSHCESLQVCALSRCSIDTSRYRAEALDPFEHIKDARLVFICVPRNRSDWGFFVDGESDTWDYAEAVVATQRQTGRRVEARKVHGDAIPEPKVINMSSIQQIHFSIQ